MQCSSPLRRVSGLAGLHEVRLGPPGGGFGAGGFGLSGLLQVCLGLPGAGHHAPLQVPYQPPPCPAAGTVVPPRASVYVASSVSGFRERASSPRGGEGLFVVGPLMLAAPSTAGQGDSAVAREAPPPQDQQGSRLVQLMGEGGREVDRASV